MVYAKFAVLVAATAEEVVELSQSPRDSADLTESLVSTFGPLAVSSVTPLGHRGLRMPPKPKFGPIGRNFAASVGVKTSLEKSRCNLGLPRAPSHL